MASAQRLSEQLERIDGRGYKAYQDIRGSFEFAEYSLFVDRVQSDPFAAPSKLRVRVPMEVAGLPSALFRGPVRRMACEDYLARAVRTACTRGARVAGSGKGGRIEIDAGGQQVLERTAVVLDPQWLEARLEVGLPAAGRRILGSAARELLLDEIPRVVREGLLWEALSQRSACAFVECIENQESIRDQLEAAGLVAFVGNGAVLPRESGASDRPMQGEGVVAFRSPPEYEVQLELPNPVECEEGTRRTLKGMGVPKGVTLIAGGGYHGKSTLLRAIEHAVYPHIPGDGREWVVTARNVVKVRAEDGRSVVGVDIRPFIGILPGGSDTSAFSTDDASGSTSQAASIQEAIEVGAGGLLLDEDTSATNFMLRDARMQALVRREHEPITPYIDRIRELHESFGVSTVLVMGGCGDYFDVADRVICMRDYLAIDATVEAQQVALTQPSVRVREVGERMRGLCARRPVAESIDPSRGRREVKISAKGRDRLLFGTHEIDLRALSQLLDSSQTRAVGYAIYLARERFMQRGFTLAEICDALDALFDSEGIDLLDPWQRQGAHPGNFARPRRYEIAAALNRLRSLRVEAI